jgi:hypothetical protein
MTADSSFSYIDASVSEKEGLPYPERGFKLLLNGLECQMKQIILVPATISDLF